MVVTKSARSLDDLLFNADYITQDRPEAGIRFLIACESAFKLIGQHPEMGTDSRQVNRELIGTRKINVPGFRKWWVFYRIKNDKIEIVRILHSSREFIQNRVRFGKTR
jgi:toxin ParE1/3/4